MLLLSRWAPSTGIADLAPRSCWCSGSAWACVMQVLVLAVQNAVAYEELGVATSGATLFRSIGGSLGTASSARSSRTGSPCELADRLPAGAGAVAAVGQRRPGAVGAAARPGPRRLPRRRSPPRSRPSSWRRRASQPWRSCSPGSSARCRCAPRCAVARRTPRRPSGSARRPRRARFRTERRGRGYDPPDEDLLVRRAFTDVILPLAVAVALAFVVQAALAKPYEIPTGSMVPTIQAARPGRREPGDLPLPRHRARRHHRLPPDRVAAVRDLRRRRPGNCPS